MLEVFCFALSFTILITVCLLTWLLCALWIYENINNVKRNSVATFFLHPPLFFFFLILHLQQLFSYYRILKTSVKIYSVTIAVCFWLKKNEPFLTSSFVSPSRFALKSLGWNFHSNERSVKRSGTLRGFRKDTSTVIGSILKKKCKKIMTTGYLHNKQKLHFKHSCANNLHKNIGLNPQ